MYKVLLNLLLLFTIVAGDSECPTVITHEDRRINKNNLRIVQYNVEWLYIDYYRNMDCPGNGCPWKTENMSYDHLLHVSNIINKFNPDIVNICEIEGCNELNYLITMYYYPFPAGVDFSLLQ